MMVIKRKPSRISKILDNWKFDEERHKILTQSLRLRLLSLVLRNVNREKSEERIPRGITHQPGL